MLRYWETEFKAIRPPRHKSGRRLYRQADIDKILKVKKLLYENRFTIEGAKNAMKEGDFPDTSKSISMQVIEKELREILNLLGDGSK